MQLIIIKILFFCLIPIGVYIFLKAIKMLTKGFNGIMLIKIPYIQKEAQFIALNDGYFSVWQSGKLFRKTFIDQFKLHIVEESSNEEISINKSLLRPQANNFTTGRQEIYRFYAKKGHYKVEFREGSNISNVESFIENLIPLSEGDESKYFIEIRESQPQIYSALAIPLILLGVFCTVGGFVFGLIADQIFTF